MSQRTLPFLLLHLVLAAAPAFAQLAPEIGYVYPPGGQAGTSVEVKIGGYDWTPDMQIFVHDPRIKLEMLGPPSEVLVPPPPYWFGAKGRGYAWPLPREFPARLTIPADVPAGLVRFQVANANGASPAGFFHVGVAPEVAEDAARKAPQVLAQIPVIVNGQIRLIEEVDRYEFTATKAGPITVELFARRFGSMLHGLLKIQDDQGKTVVDLADTEGRDFATSFIARAGAKYSVSLHDLDYAGDRSYVYRLAISPGPRILAAYPAAGKRGTTQKIEFVGLGIATGADQLESVSRDVAIPADPNVASIPYVLDTSSGPARPFTLLASDLVEQIEPTGASSFTLAQAPCAVTGTIETRFGVDRYSLAMKKDEKWRITAQAGAVGSPLDLELGLLGPDGKEVAMNDDVPGTTDPLLLFAAPADGAYTLVVTDRGGKSGGRSANYRLVVEPQRDDFTITLPALLPVPLGTVVKLTVPVVRLGAFKGPIQLTLSGLPEGITAPAELIIAEGKNDLAIDLTSKADSSALASLVTITATAKLGEQMVTKVATPVLVATTMKPRIKITPEGLDDVRKVHRGSTFLAPLLIDRLEGYAGEITLEMTAKQQRHRQGLASGEFTVPANAKRVEYPIFVPEWMETTKSSRMIVNGAVKVADPKGKVRTLLQKQELRIGILPEGALLKVSHAASATGGGELTSLPGAELRIPLTLFRAPEFREAVRLELASTDLPAGLITAEPLTLAPDVFAGTVALKFAADPRVVGERTIVLRASAQKDGKWPVISETSVVVVVTMPAPP